jgi:hypothetical protein
MSQGIWVSANGTRIRGDRAGPVVQRVAHHGPDVIDHDKGKTDQHNHPKKIDETVKAVWKGTQQGIHTDVGALKQGVRQGKSRRDTKGIARDFVGTANGDIKHFA